MNILFPLLNCRVPMDKNYCLTRDLFYIPIKLKKEDNMYMHFLCRHYSGRRNKGIYRQKQLCLDLSIWPSLLYTYPETITFSLP